MEAIPKIIKWMQGHPKALELTEKLLTSFPAAKIWADLQRHPVKGFSAVFATSIKHLTELQRTLFTRLSVFTIPFEWDAAYAVLPDAEVVAVDDALDVLVQRALVTFDGARYAYHALVRQYAYERLQKSDADPREVHRQAAAYLRERITDEARGGTPEEALEEVDQWERAEAWETFARRAHVMRRSLDRLGYWAEIEARLVRALAAVRSHLDDSKLEATLLNDRGTIALKRSVWDQAIKYYEQSLETFERLGDVHGMAQTFNNLGAVYADKGAWDRAIKMYEQSLETKERLGDVHGMAQTFNNLGSVYLQQGAWNRAIKMYEQSLETYERLGDVHGMAQTFNNLGLVYAQQGKWDQAIAMYEQSLETFERLGDVHGMAQTWGNLGIVYAQQGKWDQAIKMYEQSLEISERLGDVHGMAQTFNNLGIVYRQQGAWDRAIARYEQSLETKERLGDVHGMAQTWGNLGSVYAQQGKWDQAIKRYEQSLETLKRLGDVHGMASTWTNLGILYLQTDRPDEARPLLARAYLIFAQFGSPHQQTAANALVQAFDGDADAANAYLAQVDEAMQETDESSET
jgi:tetratricopeptide (TPR) repeat protein